MDIELHEVSCTNMYIPFIDGVLFKELFLFLEYRVYQPELIGSNLRSLQDGSGSLRIIAYRLKFFLDIVLNEGIELQYITYKEIKNILIECSETLEWKPSYFNTTWTYVRQFFEFLPKAGFMTAAVYPRMVLLEVANDMDGRFLSHTEKNTKTVAVDVDHQRETCKKDYKDKVLSMDKFHELYDALNDIDEVYATMALVQMQTCLRIENLCQIPLNCSKLNPHWMQYPELSRNGNISQEFTFIGKGRKQYTIHIFSVTIKRIYYDYIDKVYDKRKKLFQEKYMKRKNASLREGICLLPPDVLWIDKNGNPVKPSMLQNAFRQASRKIGSHVCPHKMRHTGATHSLWNFCQIHEIEPTTRLAGEFKEFLQYIMGHVSIETTKIYINTILKQRAMFTAPFAIPEGSDDIVKHLPLSVRETAKMIEFYEAKKG